MTLSFRERVADIPIITVPTNENGNSPRSVRDITLDVADLCCNNLSYFSEEGDRFSKSKPLDSPYYFSYS